MNSLKTDIAILTSREDEFGAVFDRLEEYPFEPLTDASGRTYAIFSVPITKGNKVCTVALIRYPEQNNTASQQVTNDLIRELDPSILLIVGIADGIPNNELMIGDVIVSSHIYNLVDSSPQPSTTSDFDVKDSIHSLASNVFARLPLYAHRFEGWNTTESIGLPRPTLSQEHVKVLPDMDSAWQQRILASLEWQTGNTENQSRAPLFKTGTIAANNTPIRDPHALIQWLQNTPDILAVETEVISIHQACKQYPLMAIRGISNIVGLQSDNSLTSYACQSVGAFTHAFIKAGIIETQSSNTPTPPTNSKPPNLSTPQRTCTSTTEASNSTKPALLNLFIYYSEKDERFKEELETHLFMLRRDGTIRPWYSQQTEEVFRARAAIDDHINQSQIVLPLISPNFLASDELNDQVLKLAIEQHIAGTARVIPIIIHSVDISGTPFINLQVLPRSHQPIDRAANRDETWFQIAKEIRDVCNNLRISQKKS